MTNSQDKKQIEEENSTEEASEGEGPKSVDIDEQFEAAIGHRPSGDENLADEVKAAEDNRRGKPAHDNNS